MIVRTFISAHSYLFSDQLMTADTRSPQNSHCDNRRDIRPEPKLSDSGWRYVSPTLLCPHCRNLTKSPVYLFRFFSYLQDQHHINPIEANEVC